MELLRRPPFASERFGFAAVVVALVAFAGSGCGIRNATPENLDRVLAHARAGDTIYLATGDYRGFTGASKPGMVTLKAAPGASPRFRSVWLDGARNIRFEGIHLTGSSFIRSRNIEIADSRLTGYVRVDVPDDVDHNILFDSNRFANSTVEACGHGCNEGRLTIRGYENEAPVGVQVRDSVFTGGDMDGVQLIGASYGVEIGPGNEFTGLHQGDPDVAHTDPVQLVGSNNAYIHHNYMHGNATGIMAPDGTSGERIVHNVIATEGYPWPILMGSDTGSTIRHNTLPGGACDFGIGCGTLRVYAGNHDRRSRDTVITDNVLGGLDIGDSAVAEADYNLVAAGDGHGEHDVEAAPSFVGGEEPAAVEGYELSEASPGKGTAQDGSDRGADTGSIFRPWWR